MLVNNLGKNVTKDQGGVNEVPSLCVLGPKKVPGLYQHILIKDKSRMGMKRSVHFEMQK